MLTVSAVAGGLCILVTILCLVLDLRLLTFRSGSMAPAIDTGALGVARPAAAADLRVGDVVSVPTATGSRITHRIVGIERSAGEVGLELRGDGNAVADPTTYRVRSADRLWFSVPLLGYVLGAVASPVGWILLGTYAGFLLRFLFVRPRARTSPRHRTGGRHRGATVAAVTLVLVTAAGVTGGRTSPTLAAWADATGTSGSTFGTATVPAPTAFNCGLLGLFSVAFSWNAVPGATSYTLHYGTGGSSTLTTTATNATITAIIAGGTAWVTAHRAFGATTWTSGASNTRGYTVAVVSLCG